MHMIFIQYAKTRPIYQDYMGVFYMKIKSIRHTIYRLITKSTNCYTAKTAQTGDLNYVKKRL